MKSRSSIQYELLRKRARPPFRQQLYFIFRGETMYLNINITRPTTKKNKNYLLLSVKI